MQRDYNTVVKATPSITYDPKADEAAHLEKEKVRVEISGAPPPPDAGIWCHARNASHRLTSPPPPLTQAWESFAKYCGDKVAELQVLAAEQSDYKLHRWFRRSRLWQRFPGLYSELHDKVRGTWDKDVWATYIAFRGGAKALPWDPQHGAVDEAGRKGIFEDIASKTGMTLAQLGYAPETAKTK